MATTAEKRKQAVREAAAKRRKSVAKPVAAAKTSTAKAKPKTTKRAPARKRTTAKPKDFVIPGRVDLGPAEQAWLNRQQNHPVMVKGDDVVNNSHNPLQGRDF